MDSQALWKPADRLLVPNGYEDLSTWRQLIFIFPKYNLKLGLYPTDSGRQWVGVVSKAHLRSQAVKG